MASSARKPYLRLKKSLVDFFRAPITYIKEINQKFSEFEKPYLDSEYQQMHLNWPKWNWGSSSYKPPESRPTPFGTIPRIYGVGCVVHCWHWNDCDDWVECSVLHWGGELGKQGSVEITGDVLEVAEIWGGLVDFKFKVNSEVPNPAVTVKYTDPTKQVCFDDVNISCATCNASAAIGYTSLQMAVNEEQTLEAQVGGSLDSLTGYTWAISSGGGSLSSNEGNSVTYTAPATNAECALNPTITLSCEDVVIDSVTFAVTAAVNADAYSGNCCDWQWGSPLRWAWCYGYYDCDGTLLLSSDGLCPAGGNPSCDDPCGFTVGGSRGCTSFGIDAQCSELGVDDPDDRRTAEEITAGCCPAALL